MGRLVGRQVRDGKFDSASEIASAGLQLLRAAADTVRSARRNAHRKRSRAAAIRSRRVLTENASLQEAEEVRCAL